MDLWSEAERKRRGGSPTASLSHNDATDDRDRVPALSRDRSKARQMTLHDLRSRPNRRAFVSLTLFLRACWPFGTCITRQPLPCSTGAPLALPTGDNLLFLIGAAATPRRAVVMLAIAGVHRASPTKTQGNFTTPRNAATSGVGRWLFFASKACGCNADESRKGL
jgi:hypothetical protein